MSDKPTYRAYVISPAAKKDDKDMWREVGVVSHPVTGKGFDVVIHEGIKLYVVNPEGMSLHSRIVCVEPREKPNDK